MSTKQGAAPAAAKDLIEMLSNEIEEEQSDPELKERKESVKQALAESPFKQVSAAGRLIRFENTDSDSPYLVSITMDPVEIVFPDQENPEGEADTEIPAKIEIKLRNNNKSNASLLIEGTLVSCAEGSEEPGLFDPEKIFLKRDSGSKLVKDYSPAVETLSEPVVDSLSDLLVGLGIDLDLCANLVDFAALKETETYVAWLEEFRTILQGR